MANTGRQLTGFPQLVPEGGLLRNSATALFDLGQLFSDKEGNLYRYIKANEAITKGDALTPVAKAAWDTNRAIDGALTSSSGYIVHIDTITTAMTANQYAGYYISQATAAGKGKEYMIDSHPAMAASGEGDLYMRDPIDETFADDVALLIFNPNLMELVDADTEVIKGVAICSLTSGYYGFVQVSGHFPHVKTGHSTSAAIVLNEPVVPVAANPGAVQGMAGNAETDIMEAAASLLHANQAVSANTTGFISCVSKGIL